MTWRKWHAARTLLAEEAVGVHIRQAQAEEDAAFERTREAVRRQK
jgi:hypothetical protein